MTSGRRSFITGRIAWESGPWIKKWSYTAGDHSLRGSFGHGNAIFDDGIKLT